MVKVVKPMRMRPDRQAWSGYGTPVGFLSLRMQWPGLDSTTSFRILSNSSVIYHPTPYSQSTDHIEQNYSTWLEFVEDGVKHWALVITVMNIRAM
jgi:hypothetical protein